MTHHRTNNSGIISRLNSDRLHRSDDCQVSKVGFDSTDQELLQVKWSTNAVIHEVKTEVL